MRVGLKSTIHTNRCYQSDSYKKSCRICEKKGTITESIIIRKNDDEIENHKWNS
jgi:hypothetical protein